MYRVDLTERCLFICIIFFVYIYQYTQSQSPGNNNPDRSKKHLEELEETNEDLREKELEKIYSASKAHQFLSHDKCMQRMKCPANRKEECSEECKAGNTEEEIEEHNELTRSEHRSSFSRTPKQKYDSHKDLKKRSSKNKHSSSHSQSTIKTDLFLTDHSYSMIDYDTLSLKQRTMKTKKYSRISNRSNKTISIDRSSSDKENNVSTSTNNISIPIIKTKTKSSTKKKPSRIQSKKKQNNKNSTKNNIKSTQGHMIKKKNSIISNSIDTTPSLSIEERVKLRRTKPFQTPIIPLLNKKIQSKLIKPNKTIIKSKKFFLGSGLDLDNIVLGNRQRRSIKT
ncbi:unnamed protein product [Rotaria sp. Silwood1]|nr:unnamed protein product [Rotaria sp. Silwood1]CAF4922355.1 unnamed protein product [Rotaria sp. Silwood1]